MSNSESRNMSRGWHPTENPCLDEENKNALRSVEHVAHYLETLHQPMILVGSAASWHMNNVWFDFHTVDILVADTTIVEKLTYHLTKELRAWKTTTHLDQTAADVTGAKHRFEVRRNAQVLLQRREHTPGTCLFLRIWTKKGYHMEINDKTIMLMRDTPNIWEGSKPEDSFQNPQMRLGNHFWVPTFKAFMDTLMYQSQERRIQQPYLSNDASGLIDKLIKWNYLEKAPMRELVISQCSTGAKALWLRDILDTYQRSKPVDRWDTFRKGNMKDQAVLAGTHEQKKRFRVIYYDADLHAAFKHSTGDWRRVPADVKAVLEQRFLTYLGERLEENGLEFMRLLRERARRFGRRLRDAVAHAALANDDGWAARLMEEDARSPVPEHDGSDDGESSDAEMMDSDRFWGA